MLYLVVSSLAGDHLRLLYQQEIIIINVYLFSSNLIKVIKYSIWHDIIESASHVQQNSQVRNSRILVYLNR